MAGRNANAANGAYNLAALLGIGCALAIIIIIDQKFWTYITGYVGWTYVVYADECYLTYPDQTSTNMCSFNWGMCGVICFMLLVAFFMTLCSRGRSQPTPFIVIFFVSLALWAAVAGVNTNYIPDANSQAAEEANQKGETDELHDWRNAILGVSWAGFGVALVGLLASFKDMKDFKSNPPAPIQQQFYTSGGPPPGGMYGAPPPGPPPPTYYPAPGAPVNAPPAYSAPPPAGYAGGAPPPSGYPAPPAGYPGGPTY